MRHYAQLSWEADEDITVVQRQLDTQPWATAVQTTYEHWIDVNIPQQALVCYRAQYLGGHEWTHSVCVQCTEAR